MPENIFATLTDFPPERRWREQPYPVPTVVALIQRDDPAGVRRTLLIQRVAAPYAGKWALVGGKLDFGETVAGAAVREVKEETGLDGTFVALRGVVNERLAPAGEQDDGGHFLLFVCAIDAPNGTAQEQNEGTVAWFTQHDIEDLHAQDAIIPSDYAMIKQFGDADSALPYYEVEMVATRSGNHDADAPPRLTRFERR